MFEVVNMDKMSETLNVRKSFRLLVSVEILNTFKYHSSFQRKDVDGSLGNTYGARQITRALNALVQVGAVQRLSVGKYKVHNCDK